MGPSGDFESGHCRVPCRFEMVKGIIEEDKVDFGRTAPAVPRSYRLCYQHTAAVHSQATRVSDGRRPPPPSQTARQKGAGASSREFGPRVTATPAVLVTGQLATPHPDGTILGSCQLHGAPCGAPRPRSSGSIRVCLWLLSDERAPLKVIHIRATVRYGPR
jgi:hypothetical protein